MNKRTLSIILFLAAAYARRVDGAVFTVSNNSDSGAGSLKQAIIDVNSTPAGTQSIEFTASNPAITLLTPLDFIRKPVALTLNNGQIPVTVNYAPSAVNARTLRVTTDVGVSLPDELLTLSMQSSSSGSVTLYSADNLTLVGDLGSDLLNTSTSSTAYAVYAGGTLSVTGKIKAGTKISSSAASSAYGLYSGGNISVTDNLSGDISVNATSGGTAYAIRSGMSKTTILNLTGGISPTGNITARAVNSTNNTDSTVYGIYSGGDVIIGESGQSAGISGSVSATAGYDTAYAVRGNTLTLYGGISETGSITASAGRNNGFGLYAGTMLDISGDIRGVISATAETGGSAYALYSGTSFSLTGDIAAVASISATAGTTKAYTLYAEDGDLTINGSVCGDLLAAAGTSGAYGIYSGATINIDGDISESASVTASAGTGTAYAIGGVTGLMIGGELSGDVIAKTIRSGGKVYGLYGGNTEDTSLIVTGGITETGSIEVEGVSGSTACAIYSSGSVTVGRSGGSAGIRGDISASAGLNDAYAVSGNTVTVYGGISGSGSIAATAEESGAYGIYSATTMDITGDIAASSSITATAGTNDACAISADAGDLTISGSVGGSVHATTGTSGAYGIYSGASVSIMGDITEDAIITASAGIGTAYAIQGVTGLMIGGELSGDVIAKTTKRGGKVYGLYGGNTEETSLILTGGITETGSIEVEGVSGSTAYGLYSLGDITIGRNGGSTGIRGAVSAVSGLDDAYAISGNAVSVFGGITGTVDAKAEEAGAYGIDSATTLNIFGDIAGDITATATTGGRAYALHSGTLLNVTGSITELSNVTAIAGTSKSYALCSDAGDLTISGSVNGTLLAVSGSSEAHALHAAESLVIAGNISEKASISASSATTEAYALYSEDGLISVGGIISGMVCASAGSQNAAGLYAKRGIHGATSEDALIISGSVAASAKGAAAGIIAEGPMNLFITGTLSGIDTKGTGLGYAVRSGGFAGSGEFTPSLASDDRIVVSENGKLAGHVFLGNGNDMMIMQGAGSVTGKVDLGENDDVLLLRDDAVITGSLIMGSGNDLLSMSGRSSVIGPINFGEGDDLLHLMESSKVTGDIDFGAGSDILRVDNACTFSKNISLGEGDDTLELIGTADLSQSLLIDGGSGDELIGDRIVLSDWKGVISDAFKGWERIEIAGSSTVDLDLDDLLRLAPSFGRQLTVMIEAGSTVRATGNSPGRYEIVGNLENSGLLDLRDGESNDRVEVTAAYTGTRGFLGLDLALGSGSQSDIEALDLLTVGRVSITGSGSVLGTTTLLVHNSSPGGAIKVTTGGNGILVVKVYGSSVLNAFTLNAASPVFRGADVKLVQIGRDWYLQILSAPTTDSGTDSADDEFTFVDTSVTSVASSSRCPQEHRIIEGIGGMITRLGQESVPRFHDRQVYGWAQGKQGDTESWWVRTTGSRFRSGFESGGLAVDATGYRGTMQVGSDLKAIKFMDGFFRSGVYAGTGYLKSGISGADSESAGRVDAFTMSMGGYASIEQSDTWFLEGAVQASRHDIDAAFSDGAKSSGRIWGHSASVEAGLRVGITGALYVEPQAQVLWMHNAECSMSTPAGAVTLHDTQLFVCRAGLNGQFEPEGLSFSPFFELNAERGFGGVSQVTYADTGRSWAVDSDRFHVGAALGISSRHSKQSGMEYSVKTGMLVGMNGYGSREYQLTVGLRKSW